MAETQDRDDGVWKCSLCGYLYDRDEIILDHPLSPICTGCVIDQETLDMDDVDLDGIGDFREEVRELQELERREL